MSLPIGLHLATSIVAISFAFAVAAHSGETFGLYRCDKQAGQVSDRMKARISDRDVAAYIKLAETGDIQAMSFLSSLVRKRPDGTIDQEFTNYWSQKWRSAGGNGDSEVILKAVQGEDVPLTEILPALEASARKGSAYSARELGEAYANYGGKEKYLKDLPPDMDKALYWFKYGAGLGDPEAMEVVCAHYRQGDSRNKISPNYDEAAKWCVIAAQAECNAYGATVVAHLYQCGLGGLPRNLYLAAYWSQVAHERQWGTAPRHTDKDLHFRPDECK